MAINNQLAVLAAGFVLEVVHILINLCVDEHGHVLDNFPETH